MASSSSSSFPRTRRARRTSAPVSPLSQAVAVIVFGLGLGGVAFWALTSTLDDMTRRDCQAGVVRACEEVQK
jgi:hypothetical protein